MPHFDEDWMGKLVFVTCDLAMYSCCGRGFHLCEGYEQTYQGHVREQTGEGLMLVSEGLGTVTYIVRVMWNHVSDICLA